MDPCWTCSMDPVGLERRPETEIGSLGTAGDLHNITGFF